MNSLRTIFLLFILLFSAQGAWANTVKTKTIKIGLNYPATGPYALQGLDQFRGASLAVEEINQSGGILGNKIELVRRDTRSASDTSVQNAIHLIEDEKVKMIFGGVSSQVAVAVGKVCQEKETIFMATITNSNATTRENGHRHTFRVCYNAWMGAKALSSYLNKYYKEKKYFYIVTNYTWGWSFEESLRRFTHTQDHAFHKRVLTRLGGDPPEFQKAIVRAREAKPDVLVLVLFGRDMSTAIKMAQRHEMKENIQIVVPILELALTDSAGPEIMEGVIGTSDWNWQVPYKYNYEQGKKFVEKFIKKYQRYPCWGASTAYTNMYEYANAVKRAGTFDSSKVILALENHEFTFLKDKQRWRDFDHQCVQSVYVVKCKAPALVNRDPLKMDYFEILDRFSGSELVQTKAEWEAVRVKMGKKRFLEPLSGEIK